MTNSWVTLFALLFIAYAETASAFFDPPSVSPAVPTAGQDVSVNIHGGMCDAILQEEGFPGLTVAGNAINLVEYGLHYPENSNLCVYGIGTLTQSIGAFEPGAYTLTVDLLYRHPFLGPTIFNIGLVDFTVAAAPPVEAVPSLSLSLLAGRADTLAGGRCDTSQKSGNAFADWDCNFAGAQPAHGGCDLPFAVRAVPRIWRRHGRVRTHPAGAAQAHARAAG